MPLTVKIRMGVQERVNLAHRLLPELRDWGAALVTVGLGAQRVGWQNLGGASATLSNSLRPSPPPHISALFLLVSRSGAPPPWAFPPFLGDCSSSSSMAALESSDTPSWPTGSTSSSVWRWPAQCLCSVGPLSQTNCQPSHRRPHTPGSTPCLRPLPASVGAAGLAGTSQELALPLARSSLRFQLCPSGNGDILSYEDANRAMQTGVAGIMIAR